MNGRRKAAGALVAAALVVTLAPGAAATAGNPGRFLVDGVNIRARADGNSTVVGKGYEGERVTIHCATRTDRHWYRLTAHRGNVTGYAVQDLVFNEGGTVSPPC